MSRVTKTEIRNQTEKLLAERAKFNGISEFLSSEAYKQVVAPSFAKWLSEAEAVFDKLGATPDELKDAQLKMYYVKQLQRILLNALEDWTRKSERLIELTGESK